MNRRSFLTVTGTSLAVLSAGCSSVLSNDQQRDYSFDVYNESQESFTFRIRVGNSGDGGYFHEETLDMDGRTGKEDIALDSIPSRIFIKIDSGEEQEFPWPASHSELGKIASKAGIYYDPRREQELLIFGEY